MEKKEFQAKLEGYFDKMIEMQNDMHEDATEEEKFKAVSEFQDIFLEINNLISRWLSEAMCPMMVSAEPFWVYVLESYAKTMKQLMGPKEAGLYETLKEMLDDAENITVKTPGKAKGDE